MKNERFVNGERLQGGDSGISPNRSALVGTTGPPLFENHKPVPKYCDLEWLTTFEAAEYLRISPDSLRNMTSNGKIPYSKLERRNRYKKEDLVRLLMANRRGDAHGTQI